ncbi:undecaprenyl-diphosphatase [Micromonospora kangleipakensis]|uniref:Undecaprenyl-diphosphatase n=1 Tax=Micromonospora kangleipakensis TaxID=1077942 RepID=A0A4Q8B5P6_9ACTN|nr:phosphatase PAP2 family protein [Micromonospora kangleipakensis]RZU72119.1 undecaprenyl-diphosphatase [Micromonospora kangleipakensis]
MSGSGEQSRISTVERSWRTRRLDPDHSLGLRLTVAAAAAFLVLVPFALLALLVLGAWPPLFRLDASVTDALHGYAIAHPAWVRVMSVWTDVFAPGPLRAATAVVVAWLLFRRARRLALWAVTTMVVGGLLGALLKLLVGRHRPDLLDPVARAAGFSFPSGHALNATLTAGVLLLVLLPFTHDRRPLRWALWSAAIVLAVVTGVSRIALGVHWTSDVLGGWLLGVAVVAATSAAFRTWRTRTGRRPARTAREGVEPELAGPEPDAARGEHA